MAETKFKKLTEATKESMDLPRLIEKLEASYLLLDGLVYCDNQRVVQLTH